MVLMLTACGEADQPEPEPVTTTTATEPPTTAEPTPTDEPTSPKQPSLEPTSPAPVEPSTQPPSTDEGEQPPEVQAAIDDLATHLGVDPADITVVSYADVTWPDGSIGCPQPGMSYTQALVPGSRLVLDHEGSEYAYHAGREPDLVRCDNPQLPAGDTA